MSAFEHIADYYRAVFAATGWVEWYQAYLYYATVSWIGDNT